MSVDPSMQAGGPSGPGGQGAPDGPSGQGGADGPSGQRGVDGQSGQRGADGQGGPGGPGGVSGEPTEAELRAAYEAELDRITSADMMLQAAVSLLNIGGRRLGLGGAPGAPVGVGRDLEQVRDAIDGVRALLGILERRSPQELKPLRDALSQLQMAYAREAQAGGADSAERPKAKDAAAEGSDQAKLVGEDSSGGEGKPDGPGPAQSSGRLWVPGS